VTRALSEFFAAIEPFLAGRSDIGAVTARLGPSPSGAARLALYPKLVHRQKRSVLDHFFAAARAACEVHARGSWDALAEAYVAAVPAVHWEPNHYAEPMRAFAGTGAHAEGLPSSIADLLDFAWIRYVAMNAAPVTADDPGLERAVFVRQYAHDVVTYSKAVEERGEVGGSPASGPCTLLVARSLRTHRLEIVRPSLGALVAVRHREVPDEPLRLPGGLTREQVALEDATLVALGVLAPRGPHGVEAP
jgi:hypothetical protein